MMEALCDANPGAEATEFNGAEQLILANMPIGMQSACVVLDMWFERLPRYSDWRSPFVSSQQDTYKIARRISGHARVGACSERTKAKSSKRNACVPTRGACPKGRAGVATPTLRALSLVCLMWCSRALHLPSRRLPTCALQNAWT